MERINKPAAEGSEINKQNSVSICLRQNRFTEGRGQNTSQNKQKSWNFTLEQINYINKSVDYIKSKVSNPAFFLWSNDFSNIDKNKFNFNYEEITFYGDEDALDKRIQSLYLLTHPHLIGGEHGFQKEMIK